MFEPGKCYHSSTGACYGPMKAFGKLLTDKEDGTGRKWFRDGRVLALTEMEWNQWDLREPCNCKVPRS